MVNDFVMIESHIPDSVLNIENDKRQGRFLNSFCKSGVIGRHKYGHNW